MNLNSVWHLKHPMPKNPTLDQRITWHLDHVQHCGCRGIPTLLLEKMKERNIMIPAAKAGGNAMDFDSLHDPDPKVRYGFAKEIATLAAKSPQTLYPRVDELLPFLDSENQILRWTVIDILGHLAAVDEAGKVENEIQRLIAFVHSGNLITCNHAIFALGSIAKYKPMTKRFILQELLKVAQDRFETEECHEIAIGKVVEVLGHFIPDVIKFPDAMQFVKTASVSSRNATAKKANQLKRRLVGAQ